MGQPKITVDLHGLKEFEAMLEIDRQLSMIDKSVYQIIIIHGFNKGTKIKDMIIREFNHNKKIKRIIPGSNLGETILVIREL